RDGKRVTNITPGNFDVVTVSAMDEPGRWLYYIASPDNATQRYLYRTRLDGKQSAVRVSPANAPGSHSYRISPDAHWAFHTYSHFDSPSVIELVQLPSHRVVRTLVDNAKQRAAVAPLVAGHGEFFKVAVSDGISLDGWMIKPANFDSTKVYPLLMYVYGEPAGQTAQDSWGGGHLWEHMIADQGYVVATVDNRGTPSPRGRARQAVRLHGVPQSLALHLRGSGNDAPHLLVAHPVPDGASARGGAEPLVGCLLDLVRQQSE